MHRIPSHITHCTHLKRIYTYAKEPLIIWLFLRKMTYKDKACAYLRHTVDASYYGWMYTQYSVHSILLTLIYECIHCTSLKRMYTYMNAYPGRRRVLTPRDMHSYVARLLQMNQLTPPSRNLRPTWIYTPLCILMRMHTHRAICTHSYACGTWLVRMHVGHDSCVYGMTLTYEWIRRILPYNTARYARIHVHMGHDFFVCGVALIHVHMGHDLFVCGVTLAHKSDLVVCGVTLAYKSTHTSPRILTTTRTHTLTRILINGYTHRVICNHSYSYGTWLIHMDFMCGMTLAYERILFMQESYHIWLLHMNHVYSFICI